MSVGQEIGGGLGNLSSPRGRGRLSIDTIHTDLQGPRGIRDLGNQILSPANPISPTSPVQNTYRAFMEQAPYSEIPPQNYASYQNRGPPSGSSLQSNAVPYPTPHLSLLGNGLGVPGTGNVLDPDFFDPSILSTINWLGSSSSPMDLNESMVPFSATNFNYQGNGRPPNVLHTSAAFYQSNIDHREGAARRTDNEVSQVARSDSWSGSSPITVESSMESLAVDGDPAESGEFYVDGQAARLPRVSILVSQRPLSNCPSKSFHVFDIG